MNKIYIKQYKKFGVAIPKVIKKENPQRRLI